MLFHFLSEGYQTPKKFDSALLNRDNNLHDKVF